MLRVLAAEGSNNYTLPHLGKDKLIRVNGVLPRTLGCPSEVFALAALSQTHEKRLQSNTFLVLLL